MGMKGNLLHPPPSIALYKTCQQIANRPCPVSPHCVGAPTGGASSKAAPSLLSTISWFHTHNLVLRTI